jgi:putative membrane protein
MRALTVIGVVAAAVLALAGTAAAQITTNVQAQPLGEQDREFVRKAAAGSLAEVELGRLAQQRAARPSVRSFAQRMVIDHDRAGADLAALARGRGYDAPAALEPSAQAMRDRLSALSGADFDRAYMSEMVRDHTEDVALFLRDRPRSGAGAGRHPRGGGGALVRGRLRPGGGNQLRDLQGGAVRRERPGSPGALLHRRV